MLTFVIVIVISITGLAIIATNEKIHTDARFVMAWGWGMLTILALERFM